MAIAFVNATSGANGTGLNQASIAGPAIDVAAGNLLHVFVQYFESGGCTNSLTVTDTGSSNTFTKIGSSIGDSVIGCSQQFYAKNAIAVSGDVITANFSPSVPYVEIIVLQFSAEDTVAPLDVTAATIGGPSTSVVSDPFTPTQVNEVAVAVVGAEVGTTFTAGTNYTIPTGATTSFGAGEYRLNAPASSQTATMTLEANHKWHILVATYKVAAAVIPAPEDYSGRFMPLYIWR